MTVPIGAELCSLEASTITARLGFLSALLSSSLSRRRPLPRDWITISLLLGCDGRRVRRNVVLYYIPHRATYGIDMSSQSGAPGADAMNLLWSLPILKARFVLSEIIRNAGVS